MTDPHAPAKLSSIRTVAEADGWIAEARHRGDTDAERAGLARKYQIERGR